MPTFLHVGCGQQRKDGTTRGFNRPEWREIRLDISPTVQPDIVGSMTDMPDVESGSVDAVFSSHNIEHLFAHEAPLAFAEFRRVLRAEGFLVITCPDMQSVAALIANDRLNEPAYVSPAGPISPHDIIYGHGPSVADGQVYMAHKSGYTRRSLIETLKANGFASVAAMQRPRYFDLWALATKTKMDGDKLQALVLDHFPVQPQAA